MTELTTEQDSIKVVSDSPWLADFPSGHLPNGQAWLKVPMAFSTAD